MNLGGVTEVLMLRFLKMKVVFVKGMFLRILQLSNIVLNLLKQNKLSSEKINQLKAG